MARRPLPGDGTYGLGTIRQRGKTWQVRFRAEGRQQSASGFQSKQEAADALQAITARLGAGLPALAVTAQPQAERPATAPLGAFADLLDAWVEYQVSHRRRGALEERARWELHLARPLQTQTVKGLTSRWVRNLAGELVAPTTGSKGPDGTPKAPISGPTAHRCLTLLSSFYTWAVEEGHADVNPVQPALRHKAVKALLRSAHDKDAAPYLRTWEAVDRLYQPMAQTSVGIAYYLQARAGLRPGEAVALRWGSVDLDAGTAVIRANVRHGKEGPTKGGKPRTVPLSPSWWRSWWPGRRSPPARSRSRLPSDPRARHLPGAEGHPGARCAPPSRPRARSPARPTPTAVTPSARSSGCRRPSPLPACSNSWGIRTSRRRCGTCRLPGRVCPRASERRSASSAGGLRRLSR